MASNNSSSTSLYSSSTTTTTKTSSTCTTSPAQAATQAAAAAAAAATAAMVSSSLYLPQTYSFLSPETFETLVEGYINQLHIRKRNKALINQQLANDCLMVLTNPENTAIFNPKFRILMDKKNGKPVRVREQLYDKVCYFHHIIGHGGRDKTFAAETYVPFNTLQITKSYSKVPAELVSLFTKNCQTCLRVRKYSKNKRPVLNEFDSSIITMLNSNNNSRHLTTLICNTCNTSGFSSSYHHQQQQSMHNMMTKVEHGVISPISPMMHHAGSGFFGSNGHFHSAYTQAAAVAAAAAAAQSQQQQQQLQQQHHAALASHLNMSMSLSDISLGGHLNTATATTAPTDGDTSPSILTKMELPLHQLMHPGPYHHQHHQHHHHHSMMASGLHSPTDLPEHHFLPQQESSPAASSCLPATPAPPTTAAATSFIVTIPILPQVQLFQKQIQHEHHRLQQQQQQQQHKFFPEGLMAADLTTTSSAASSSIPTLTSASPLSNLLDDHEVVDGSSHHDFSDVAQYHHHHVEATVGDL
ncbi:hypothetical protein BGX33_005412 [Mortierella sp. NVP41]|nr:hypothetical protein BGX33_005412 [Mortierella sp. NVP41]